MSLSDQKIRDLWTDPAFAGSFQSALHMQGAIFSEFGQKIPLHRIYKVLSEIDEFQQQIRTIKHFERRNYKKVRGFMKLCQMDVAMMPKYRKKTMFLSFIDVFSKRIWARVIKRKTSSEILNALKSIFQEIGIFPEQLNSDLGKEFQSHELHDYFKSKGIFYRPRPPVLKASFSEWSIMRIKNVLYNQMRYTGNQNWIKLLPEVIKRINNTPMPVLNGLKPNDFQSKLHDVKLPLVKSPHWKTLLENQTKYEKNSRNLQVGQLVLLDKYLLDKHNAFPKGFSVQVSKIMNEKSILRHLFSMKEVWLFHPYSSLSITLEQFSKAKQPIVRKGMLKMQIAKMKQSMELCLTAIF